MYSVGILLLILFVSPLICIISLCILIFEGGPIFFVQRRVGRYGKVFEIYKFRTMVLNSETLKKSLLKKNEANGPVFKIKNDPRFTRTGKFLAHTGLDELPQLWNVLKGDMALIGPRPLPVDEAKKLKPWQQKRHDLKPGIISPWILEGYHTMKFDEWMKSDIGYVKRKSIPNDLLLSFRVCNFLITLFIKEVGFNLLSRKF